MEVTKKMWLVIIAGALLLGAAVGGGVGLIGMRHETVPSTATAK